VRSSKLKIHKDAVTSLSLHPTQDFILSASNDKSWAFTDIFAERDIVRVYDEDRVTTAQFHPDGLILGTGTSRAEVKIWDLKASSNVSLFNFSFFSIPKL
jgi:pre-mRNA-processing factor 19